MFNNKKLGIRLVAILMTLLMTVAIFAGCSDKDARAKAEAAQSQADVANAAAAAANAAAQSAADAAAALAAQLAAAQASADSAKAAAESAKDAAAAAQSGLSSYISGDNKPVTGVITNDEQKKVTDYINSTVLGELSQLKVKYLTVRYLWYTEANYNRIAKMFDDAYMDIYRATTIDGVKGVIAKLTTDVAAIQNIVSDAEAIQAQIKAFGDVDTDLFTTQATSVSNVRTAYSQWLLIYKSYFQANGLKVDNYNSTVANENSKAAIDTYVLKTFGLDTVTLGYAESKIVTLKAYAKDTVSVAVYNAVKEIWNATDYSTIKTKSELIQNAYNLYKIFMTANGGDGSSIKTAEDKSLTPTTLTGEQFVKQFVLVLYDNWFEQYKTAAAALVNTLPDFFMNGTNPGMFETLAGSYLGIYDTAAVTANYTVNLGAIAVKTSGDSTLKNEFNKVAVLNNAEFLNLTYSGSFKGTLSLEDAYLQVDNYVARAMAEMASLYYSKIAIASIQSNLASKKSEVDTYANSTDLVYKDFDKAFATEYKAAIDAYTSEIAKTAMKTYEELKATTNIENIRVFAVDTQAAGSVNDVKTTYNNAVLTMITKAMNEAVKSASSEYALNVDNANDLKAFYEFKKALCTNLTAYAASMDAWNDPIIVKMSDVRVARGGSAITDAEANTLKAANKAIDTSFRTAVMALKYDSFSATTYQATNAKGKVLYYNKDTSDKALTTKDNAPLLNGKNPLNVTVDKIVVAKNKVVSLYAEYADKMLKNTADLCRTQVSEYIDKTLATYNTNYAGDSTVDKLNIKADIEKYVAYVKGMATLSTIGTFNPALYSLESDSIAEGISIDAIVADGYALEVTDTNTYALHVADYYTAATANYIATDDATSYAKRSDAKLTEYSNMVINKTVDANLNNVRVLAFYKDEAIVKLDSILASVKGTWDATKGEWVAGKAPLYTYDYYSSRKVMYLSEVDKVYTRLADAIKSVTMLDEDVINKADPFAAAIAKIDSISILTGNPQDNEKASKSNDDYSFKVAFARYYAVDVNAAPFIAPYNWAAYNAQ